MLALTVAVVLVAVVFVLTSGALIGPDAPRSGPEAWIRDDAGARQGGTP